MRQGRKTRIRHWAGPIAALALMAFPVAAQAGTLTADPPSSNFTPRPYFPGEQQFNNFNVNNADTDTTFNSATITGPDAAQFSINGDFCAGQTRQPGQGCNVGVNFVAPGGTGTFTAQLEIPSQDGTPNPLVIPLSAEVLAGPAYTASPTRLDFGPVLLGSSSSQQLTITNVGDFQGGVQQAFVVGPTEFQIEDDLCSQVPLDAGDSCTLTARFVPSAAREFQGAIFAIVASQNTPVLPINLSGVGRALPGPAPVAQITKRPAAKTRSKTASFQFTSTAADVRFECKLDGESFSPCTSPSTYGVGRGGHTFQVRAKDASGNVGAAETASWNVTNKKKKKKKKK